MTNRVIRSSAATAVALAAAGLALTAFMSGAAAQNGAPAPSVPTPRRWSATDRLIATRKPAGSCCTSRARRTSAAFSTAG